MIFLAACSTSGNNAVTRTSAYPRVIEQARKDKNYFIMHSGLDTFAVTSLLVEKNKQDFTVHLNKLDSLRRALLTSPLWYAKRIARRILKGPRQQDRLLVHEIRGYMSGLLFYLRTPRPTRVP